MTVIHKSRSFVSYSLKLRIVQHMNGINQNNETIVLKYLDESVLQIYIFISYSRILDVTKFKTINKCMFYLIDKTQD